jgi:hypothetical protein
MGPHGKTYREWNKWAGDLALAGLKERNLDEEKFFESFFEDVMSKGPFSLQTQSKLEMSELTVKNLINE